MGATNGADDGDVTTFPAEGVGRDGARACGAGLETGGVDDGAGLSAEGGGADEEDAGLGAGGGGGDEGDAGLAAGSGGGDEDVTGLGVGGGGGGGDVGGSGGERTARTRTMRRSPSLHRPALALMKKYGPESGKTKRESPAPWRRRMGELVSQAS